MSVQEPSDPGPDQEAPAEQRLPPPAPRRRPLEMMRASYGAGHAHLVGLTASFALTAVAVAGWFQRPHDVTSIIKWLVAAIIAHDLVVLPLYSALDRVVLGRRASRVGSSVAGTRPPSGRAVEPHAYVRIPTILSLLLLVVFSPVIFGLGARAELTASGIPEHGYLARWLLAAGAMYAVAGVAYLVARWRAAARVRTRPSRPGSPRPR